MLVRVPAQAIAASRRTSCHARSGYGPGDRSIEADFLPCSFGFRPRRSQHDALQVLVDEAWDGSRWVAESDVSDCFGAIPHSGLMSAIEERISDRHVLKLLRAMLRAGVMEDDAVRRDVTGTPQGAVIS